MRILLLCTGNSCRSQMAEGFARQLLKGWDIWSAGTRPAERVHPLAVQVMAEKGIDISSHYPKLVHEVPLPVDYVVTLCGEAAEECPAFPGAKHTEHWGLPDPARATGTPEEVLGVFRSVRDEIERRMRELAERTQSLRDTGE
ncbi:MAG: arsenate reductase ArsC [Armatimonadota bacterium]|nr:arsenate reductase ArsC [Armatimonadota bacterium]